MREQKNTFQRYLAQLIHDAGASLSVVAQIAILVEGAQITAAIAGCPDAAARARAAVVALLDSATADV
ncbi:hypothetical protein ACL02S_15925 [Nocardia sp. 004]|uniref:hypothetical protein n=1 Tax=Nocardia sp. 004 TaxID=3385978 RepID=UPI0039A2F6B9